MSVQITDEQATAAYLYGYSLDEAYKFLYETTITPGGRLNEFQKLRDLADDTYTAHPTINNDTLHLQGWFDVAAEPVIVTIPDFDDGRYWILHTMDLGHYTNAMIGSRTRGTVGGRFLFAARDWDGQIPAGIDEVIRSESNLIKVMGRIMTIGDDDDLHVARDLQDRWKLQLLSEVTGSVGPTAVVRSFPDPDATSWVERVNFVLADGSIAATDASWLTPLAGTGVGDGTVALSEAQQEAAERGRRLGMDRIRSLAPTLTNSKRLLGTRADLQHEDRDVFAEGTYLGQWGLPPVESVYLKAETGSDGKPLNASGGKTYRARFLPPDVSEFWSVTVYGDDNRLMAHNNLNRHSRGDRTLTPDAEGYYTIELGSDDAANHDNPNYLPLPEKDSYIVLRLYGPSQAIQDGGYTMPVFDVTRAAAERPD